jgi:hypothetical protein
MAETPAKKAATPSAPPERPVLTPDMPQPPKRGRRVRKAQRKGPFVKYVGHASCRQITPPDWKTLAHENPPKDGFQTDTWDLKNDFMIESSKFTDEQLDYLLIDDVQGNGAHSFLEVDYDADGNLAQVVEDDEE